MTQSPTMRTHSLIQTRIAPDERSGTGTDAEWLLRNDSSIFHLDCFLCYTRVNNKWTSTLRLPIIGLFRHHAQLKIEGKYWRIDFH